MRAGLAWRDWEGTSPDRTPAGATGEGPPLPGGGVVRRGSPAVTYSSDAPSFFAGVFEADGSAGGLPWSPPPPVVGGGPPWPWPCPMSSGGGSLGLESFGVFALASPASRSSQKAATSSAPPAALISSAKAAASGFPPRSTPLPSWNALQSPSSVGTAAGPAAAVPVRGPRPVVAADPPEPVPPEPAIPVSGAADRAAAGEGAP